MTTQAAIYNARKPEMPVSTRRARCLLCALFLAARLMHASDWRTPESELAAKIAAITGPGIIALEVKNRSSISSSDVEKIRRDLPGLLAASGVRISVPNQASASVTVALSENLQNYVWLAEIRQGMNEPSIVMIFAPRPVASAIAQNAPPLILRATPLISQPDPILDVAIIAGDQRRLLALGDSSITSYEFRDNRWIAGQSAPIISQHPLPRDLRGRIMFHEKLDFNAYLPGLVCRSANSSTLAVNCLHSDDPWPLQTQDLTEFAFFAPSRNFFTGALIPGIGQQKTAPAFYSAAALPRLKYTLWILAGVDGQLHLLDGINHQTLPKIRWGADIAAIHAACRGDWQVLATSLGTGPNNEKNDSVQAFEFPDREPVPVSQKLKLNGSITALWTSQDGNSATAVFRNPETGDYEAVALELACGQ